MSLVKEAEQGEVTRSMGRLVIPGGQQRYSREGDV